MKEIICDAICLGGYDYKESDKMIKLITAGSGVITALMRGVKKEKAKLKFAAMPFSFCEYTLFTAGGFYTVKNAVQLQSLFELADNPDDYIIGSIMLELTSIAMGGVSSPNLFVFLLTALKLLLYSDKDGYSLLLNYVCRLLKDGGHYVVSERDADYDCEISEQEFIEIDRAESRIKNFIKMFQSKYNCAIKSASLL